jgi:hypothetical protein
MGEDMNIDVAAEDAYEPKGPKPIYKLSNDVINQIAAAEVGCRASCLPARVDAEDALDHTQTCERYQGASRELAGRRVHLYQSDDQGGRSQAHPDLG